MTWPLVLLVVLAQQLTGAYAFGDELRPAYLAMRETGPHEFSVLWKVPAIGNRRLGLYVRLPETCNTKAEPIRSIEEVAFFERWTVACSKGMKGQEISIDGLRHSATDVIVRMEHRGGTTQVTRLNAASPVLVVAGDQTGLEVARTYFLLGADHILTSLDHLLFVLALILLIRERGKLVKTITAFTVAHSFTLAGSALGYLSLPQKPVETTIALSIAFLASELIKTQPGEPRLSQTYPWIAAFAFGLLHGFGFAGALKEIGLPRADVPFALLAFNLGVEAGQLVFVLWVVIGSTAAKALFDIPLKPARVAAAYVIGTTSMVWLISTNVNAST